jgi:hypothetical protein
MFISSAIAASSGMGAVGRYLWEVETVSAEDWTVDTVPSQTWTPQTVSSETWTRQ